MDRIGDAVGRELRRFGPQAGLGEVVGAWPEAVGETIARNAWPARIGRDGTLHANTTSSTWAFELAQLAPTVLERLRAALGQDAPKGLRFAVGPVPEQVAAESPEQRAARAPRPGPAERAAAAQLTAGMADDELRGLVARAAAASLARPRDDRSF